MQSEGSFPEEHRGRRPPPSTSSPCPAWFFRLRSPFFRGSKTPVQKRFAPLQLLALVQLAQKRPPDVQPHAPLLPVSQPPPAGRGMREFLRHVLPASPASQNPQNPFQHMTVLNPGTTALALFGRLGEQGRDLLPLRFGQQRTRSGHRPSLGAADSAYLSSQKIQLPSFQDAVSGYATASNQPSLPETVNVFGPRTMIEDRDGSIWAGTGESLVRLQRPRVRRITNLGLATAVDST